MAYQPYLIGNYQTALDKRLQPWLAPNDAQLELYDGFVYRGTISKRQGYKYLATGGRDSKPYCESRMVNQIAGVNMTGVINSVNTTYTTTLMSSPVQTPIRRGGFVVTGTVPAQTVRDDGVGGFTGDGTGTINYTTGAVSIVFNTAPTGGTVTATYEYHPGLPVMGVMNFVTATNAKQLIVADTKRLNLYNTTTNRLDYLGTTLTITGISNANPGQVTCSAAHNLGDGDQVFIYGVEGMTSVNCTEYTITSTGANTFTIGIDTSALPAYSSGGTVQHIYTGTNENFWSWVNYPDASNNPRLIFTNNKDQVQYYAPNLSNSVGDYVYYPTKAAPDFNMSGVTKLLALQTTVNKDRLLFLRTTEDGTVRPQRIRISGTGANHDNFSTAATGAGFIDIPDGSWLNGSSFNRDDLVIFSEQQTWALKYTGNDTTPFVVQKIDESRGSGAAFSVITYLNRTSAASPRGLIISDGYRVERQDEEIPDFSFDEIDQDYFKLAFAGTVDADRDHYLIYPPPGETSSKRILVTNYDEDNYSVYRLPMSCMGNYILGFDFTWADLTPANGYNNWADFAAAFENWNAISYSKGAPFSVGGGHKGEIWNLNTAEGEDNPQFIRNITVIDDETVEITTDWNNYGLNTHDQQLGADVIFVSGVSGMVEINNKQFAITSVTNNYTFRVKTIGASSWGAYTSGGGCSRVIPFTTLFKKFNPYVNEDRKVRCGWLYMYVDTTGTNLTRNINIVGITNADPCVITTNVAHNLTTGDIVQLFGIGGTTQLNGDQYPITVISSTTFSLDGVNSTAYGVFTSGGYASVSEPCKAVLQVITDDNNEATQLNNGNYSYQGNCSNLEFETGSKKWYKVYINQTAKFIQFRVSNTQAGSTINIQALMPGFAPVGRLI